MKRANAEFVPLVLRAPLVNGQPAGDPDEADVYRRVRLGMLAPQGIGILDGRGNAIAWTQMFESDEKVGAFLDRGIALFKEDPAGCETYSVFPSDLVKKVAHAGGKADLPRKHEAGEACPAARGKGRPPAGSLVVGLTGRALDADGAPVSDTVNQEHYIEDAAWITPSHMADLAEAAAAHGDERFDVPDALARALATRLHLGHIDVQPFLDFGAQGGNRGEWKRCSLRARRVSTGDGVTLFRLTGRTEIACTLAVNGEGTHDIALKWEGWFEMRGEAMTSFVAIARGRETLRFGNERPASDAPEVRSLPGGRVIDQESGVVYGMLGVPAKDCAEPGESGPPESLLEKIRTLHETVERVRGAGRDPSAIGKIMEEFEPHVRKREFAEAEAVVDRALEALAEMEDR